jgi:maltose 6'-phosphate phosphatase
MRLLTLNCHSWQEENQLEKIEYLAKVIADHQYDVIALQEVSQTEMSPIVYDNVKQDNYGHVLVERVNHLSKEKYVLKWTPSHRAYDVYEEGVAILTKHQIEDVETTILSKSDNFDFWKTRASLVVDILIDNERITFVSCHIGWWEDEEEPSQFQIDNLLPITSRKHLVFLMGDFNSEASVREEGYDYLLANDIYDTFELAVEKDSGITVPGSIAGWEASKKSKRIDYIFTNQPIKVQSSKVIFNEENHMVISDHYGVEITI